MSGNTVIILVQHHHKPLNLINIGLLASSLSLVTRHTLMSAPYQHPVPYYSRSAAARHAQIVHINPVCVCVRARMHVNAGTHVCWNETERGILFYVYITVNPFGS
jgi:hypothetical protein